MPFILTDAEHRLKPFEIEIPATRATGGLAYDGHVALLTVRAAADRLGVAYSTLKRWVLSGRVRTSRTEGGHHRIAEAEVERLLAKQGSATPSPARRPWGDEPLAELSARNRLHGYIEEVRVDGLLAQVRLRVGDQTLTAVITADAVKAMKFARGEDALAIIKSTEVMIARVASPPEPARRRPRTSAASPRSGRRRAGGS